MALLPSMTQLGYWKLRCARVDLGGRGRLGVHLRQLLSCRFGSLQRFAAVGPALHWLLRCGTTSTTQVDLIAGGLHGLQRNTTTSLLSSWLLGVGHRRQRRRKR